MEIRIDNVNEVLAAIGLTGQHERKGQGWHRVYIHAPQEGTDVTLYLGRVMFQHGVNRQASRAEVLGAVEGQGAGTRAGQARRRQGRTGRPERRQGSRRQEAPDARPSAREPAPGGVHDRRRMAVR